MEYYSALNVENPVSVVCWIKKLDKKICVLCDSYPGIYCERYTQKEETHQESWLVPRLDYEHKKS